MQVDAPPQARPEPTQKIDRGRSAEEPPRLRLDPAVLELLRRCCGEECVSRLLACHE